MSALAALLAAHGAGPGGPSEQQPEGRSFTDVLTETIQDCHELIAHAPDPAHKAMVSKALSTLLQVQKEVYGPQNQQGGGAQSMMGALGR